MYGIRKQICYCVTTDHSPLLDEYSCTINYLRVIENDYFQQVAISGINELLLVSCDPGNLKQVGKRHIVEQKRKALIFEQ